MAVGYIVVLTGHGSSLDRHRSFNGCRTRKAGRRRGLHEPRAACGSQDPSQVGAQRVVDAAPSGPRTRTARSSPRSSSSSSARRSSVQRRGSERTLLLRGSLPLTSPLSRALEAAAGSRAALRPDEDENDDVKGTPRPELGGRATLWPPHPPTPRTPTPLGFRAGEGFARQPSAAVVG